MNTIALFVTHSVFLTDEQIKKVVDGERIESVGHCVPVWVDAKTGNTTEPAKEIFCSYAVQCSSGDERDVRPVQKKGYEIFIPKSSSWSPPEALDYEKIALLPSEERMALNSSVDHWWFSNPRPMDASDLARGYIRFDVKRSNKIGSKNYSEQHVVEIAGWKRLLDSLAT